MSDPIDKLTNLGDALEGAPMPLPASAIRARGDRIRRRKHALVAGASAGGERIFGWVWSPVGASGSWVGTGNVSTAPNAQLSAVFGGCTAGGAYIPALSDEVVMVRGNEGEIGFVTAEQFRTFCQRIGAPLSSRSLSRPARWLLPRRGRSSRRRRDHVARRLPGHSRAHPQ